MFDAHNFVHPSDLVCVKAPSKTLDHRDFEYFDARGYRLNAAEEEFYRANNHHIDAGFCDTKAWATNWLMKNDSSLWDRFLLNHAFTSYRCNYRGPAYDHIVGYAEHLPAARSLLSIRPKWGFEFSLSFIIDEKKVIEVCNIKFDSYIHREFNEVRKETEDKIINTNWFKESEYILDNTDEWKFLDYNRQADWKANHLLGWNNADRSLSAIIV